METGWVKLLFHIKSGVSEVQLLSKFLNDRSSDELPTTWVMDYIVNDRNQTPIWRYTVFLKTARVILGKLIWDALPLNFNRPKIGNVGRNGIQHWSPLLLNYHSRGSLVIQANRQCMIRVQIILFHHLALQGPLLLTWINFNPSMDK